MVAHSSARYQDLLRALHSVQELTHDLVVQADLFDAGSTSPDAGFTVTFDDRRRGTA